MIIWVLNLTLKSKNEKKRTYYNNNFVIRI